MAYNGFPNRKGHLGCFMGNLMSNEKGQFKFTSTKVKKKILLTIRKLTFQTHVCMKVIMKLLLPFIHLAKCFAIDFLRNFVSTRKYVINSMYIFINSLEELF